MAGRVGRCGVSAVGLSERAPLSAIRCISRAVCAERGLSVSLMRCPVCDRFVDTDEDLDGNWSDFGYTCTSCYEWDRDLLLDEEEE